MDDYLEACADPSKRNMDRNRGLQADAFTQALLRAAADTKKAIDDTGKLDDCQENSGQ